LRKEILPSFRDSFTSVYSNIWKDGLSYAVYINRLDLFKQLIEKGKKHLSSTSIGLSIYFAGMTGNMEMINYLLNEFGNQYLDRALEGAVREGRINIIKTYLLITILAQVAIPAQ
jgi:ankyrin repeat protein